MRERIPVLVIDDDPVIRKLVAYNLKLAGFKVYLAEDGISGVKLAKKKSPKLILLDVMMPQMDGLEVLSELKYHRKTTDIPVFMMTAKNTFGDIDRAFEIGADDYLTKPLDLRRLGQTVKEKLDKLTKT